MTDLLFTRENLTPVMRATDGGQWCGCAAVLVALAEYKEQLSLLLTRRALSLRVHGGEVAFPGGMWELGDNYPVTTALREAEEEVGLCSQWTTIEGLLPETVTRRGTKVRPVVASLSAAFDLQPNPDEIESIFFIPISELLVDRRIRTDVFSHRCGAEPWDQWAPAYHYQGYEIWGMTALVIKYLLRDCLGVALNREHRAQEQLR